MNHWTPPAPPCANCGKYDAGRMVSSGWLHSHPCCSDACAARLGAKLANGMGGVHESLDVPWGSDYSDADRIINLRIEIKLLRHRLKAAAATNRPSGECQHRWQPDADVEGAVYCPKCDVTRSARAAAQDQGEGNG